MLPLWSYTIKDLALSFIIISCGVWLSDGEYFGEFKFILLQHKEAWWYLLYVCRVFRSLDSVGRSSLSPQYVFLPLYAFLSHANHTPFPFFPSVYLVASIEHWNLKLVSLVQKQTFQINKQVTFQFQKLFRVCFSYVQRNCCPNVI